MRRPKLNVIIPNKDFLLVLNSFTKKIISGSPVKLCPLYPLWIFTEHSIPNDIVSFELTGIGLSGTDIFYHAEIRYTENGSQETMKEKLRFARLLEPAEENEIMKEISRWTESLSFPLRQRVFRTGTVEQHNNSWRLYDEKWHKLNKVN